MDDLDKIREEHQRTMSEALHKAELLSYIGVKMINYVNILGRISFNIRKGFTVPVNDYVYISIFGDGNLIYANNFFLDKNELNYSINKKVSNLPLLEYKRIAICVAVGNNKEMDNEANLFLVNTNDSKLLPVSYNEYRAMNFC